MSPPSSPETPPRSSKADPGLRVVLRNQGVYTLYRKIVGQFWVNVALAVMAVMVASFFIFQKTPPQYTQAAPDGQLVAAIPLDKPNLDESGIFDLARRAITKINRFDYINYRTQLPEAQEYFTGTGWTAYLAQLKARDTLTTVEQSKAIVGVEFSGPPTLENTAVVDPGNGPHFVWKVNQPVVVNYTSTGSSANSSRSLRQEGIVTLIITRVPYTESPHGAQVQLYNFMEKSGGPNQ